MALPNSWGCSPWLVHLWPQSNKSTHFGK